MAKNNLLSLPVQSHNNPAKIVNLINIFDLLLYITAHPDKLDSNIECAMTLDADRESYLMLTFDYSLPIPIQKFTTGHLHRALLVDDSGQKAPLVFTQTDILQYFYDHKEECRGDLNAKVDSVVECDVGKLVVLRDSASAIEGLELMKKKKVLALPVVNSVGDIVANLSSSDLRGITSDLVDKLKLPVLEYLDLMKSKTAIVPNPGCEPIVVSKETTVKQALELLVGKHIHRVWVVEGRKVCGVLSLSDAIKILST